GSRRAGQCGSESAAFGAMKQGPDQIALPLDWPQGDGDQRFIVGEANRDAFDHFRKFSMWPVKATILTGPRRSGRTLLARTFVDRGLHIPAEALRFMNERLHRDYWTVERAVEAVDRYAIAERARLSLPTIRRALIESRMIGEAA